MSYLASREEKMDQRYSHIRNKGGGNQKGETQLMEKERGSVRFSLLGGIKNGTIVGEVSENQVIVATRQLAISDISGEGSWGNKNWPKECSIIIGAGFNGCGLRIFDRLRKYLEYIRSFYHKANMVQTKEKLLKFAFWESPRARFNNGYRDTYMGEWEFQTGAR